MKQQVIIMHGQNAIIKSYMHISDELDRISRESNDLFSESVAPSEINRFISLKKSFHSTKDDILESFSHSKEKGMQMEDKNISHINYAQTRINVISIESTLNSKSDFLNRYNSILDYNRKISSRSNRSYIKAMRHINLMDIKSFDENAVIWYKHEIDSLRRSYIRTDHGDFRRMRNQNTCWLKSINNSLAGNYVDTNIAISKLEKDAEKISRSDTIDNPKSRSRMLVIEEDIPKMVDYCDKLQKAFYAITDENSYRLDRNTQYK